MASPDPHTTSNLLDALKLAGGGILGAALAAFARNFFTTGGNDAREFRAEYRDEIKRLRDARTADQEEIEELRDDIRNLRGALDELRAAHEKQLFDLRAQIELLTVRNQQYLIGRTEARALLNALERRTGLSPTPWPPDVDTTTPPRFIDPTGDP